jgi:hypothetical protein
MRRSSGCVRAGCKSSGRSVFLLIRATSAPAQINHFNLDDSHFHFTNNCPLVVTVKLAGSLLRTVTETNFFRSLTRPI